MKKKCYAIANNQTMLYSNIRYYPLHGSDFIRKSTAAQSRCVLRGCILFAAQCRCFTWPLRRSPGAPISSYLVIRINRKNFFLPFLKICKKKLTTLQLNINSKWLLQKIFIFNVIDCLLRIICEKLFDVY